MIAEVTPSRRFWPAPAGPGTGLPDGGWSQVSWPALSLVGAAAGVGYVALEWLFFATKPSVLSVLPLGHRLLELLTLSLMAAALLAVATGVPATIAHLLTWRPWRVLWATLSRLLPGIAVASAALLLADNFTITLLGFGVPGSRGVVRLAYAAGLALLLVQATRGVRGAERRLSVLPARGVAVGLGALLTAAALWLLCVALATKRDGGGPAPWLAAGEARPNVLVVGPDGVDAGRTSLHGYHRDTTPFLRELAASSLVCERAFTNCGNTTGSIVALLTGKLPTTTRVVTVPDILRGRDAFEHLPGILRRRSYRCLDVSVRSFADPVDLNVREGFDRVGDRVLQGSAIGTLTSRWLGETAGYLTEAMASRLADRVGHLLLGRQMADPFAWVTRGTPADLPDRERVNQVLRFVDAGGEPFFAHAHLLGTHGPRFAPRQRVFSAHSEGTATGRTDLLDDAILEADSELRALLEGLRRRGVLERTVVVVYSDHAHGYRTDVPVPLLLRFPGAAHAGRVAEIAQLVDVAPTVLDALGVPIPSFMEGVSLLRRPLDPCRAVVSVRTGRPLESERSDGGGAGYRPPFYALGAVELTGCGYRYVYDLSTRLLGASMASPRDAGCVPCPVPSQEEARATLVAALARGGYDTSSLARRVSRPTRSGPPQGGDALSRGEAAAELARLLWGDGGELPPPRGDVLADVPVEHPEARAIEAVAGRGLLVGGADHTFRPADMLTRGQLAVLVVRVLRGPRFLPPRGTGEVFDDVPAHHAAARFIEQLERDLGPVACGERLYCPSRPATLGRLQELLRRAVPKVQGRPEWLAPPPVGGKAESSLALGSPTSPPGPPPAP